MLIRDVKITREAINGKGYATLSRITKIGAGRIGVIARRTITLACAVEPSLQDDCSIADCREDAAFWGVRLDHISEQAKSQREDVATARLIPKQKGVITKEQEKLRRWLRNIEITREALDGSKYSQLSSRHNTSKSHTGLLIRQTMALAGKLQPRLICVPSMTACREDAAYWSARLDQIDLHVHAKLKEIGLAPG